MRMNPKRTNRERGGAVGTFLLLLLIGGSGAAWWWYGLDRAPPPIDADRVVSVERRDVLKAVLATGRVEPLARVSVMSRASGILKDLLVDEGDVVENGQIIAELDREQLVAQHNENVGNQAAAEARLAAAAARLGEARVKLDDPELDFARTQLQRLQDLFDDGSASLNELDDAKLRVAMVEYRIRQVEASIPVLQAEVKRAEADIIASNASVERSGTALREATIRSPIDGIVLVREKEVGDGISSILTAGGNATPMMTIGDVSAMFVEARVDEVDVGRIHDGMRAVIEVDAYRGHRFEGRVVRIAPAGTVDNNGIVTFLVKIAVDDSERRLRVDMTANTRLVLEERPDTLTLPHKALTHQRDGSWVAQRVVAQKPPQVADVPVEIGVTDGLVTEILTGLAEGDEVLLPSERRGGGPPG